MVSTLLLVVGRGDSVPAAWILALHLAVIAFNVGGMVAIPLGAWRGWRWVRAPLWRMLHLVSLAIVALQGVLGRACFLTIWQDDLQGRAAVPLIQQWVNHLVFWPLPMAAFTVIYLAVLLYVLWLWWRWPPKRQWRG